MHVLAEVAAEAKTHLPERGKTCLQPTVRTVTSGSQRGGESDGGSSPRTDSQKCLSRCVPRGRLSKGTKGRTRAGSKPVVTGWRPAGAVGQTTGRPHTRLEVRVANLMRAASQRLSPTMCTRELPGKVRIVYGSAIKHPLCAKTWV